MERDLDDDRDAERADGDQELTQADARVRVVRGEPLDRAERHDTEHARAGEEDHEVEEVTDWPFRHHVHDCSRHMVSQAVLITGCSTGIGRATAERLAKRGHTVYATARRLDSIADLSNAGCRTLQLDVTDEASMRAAVDAVEREHGAVGALVNNAGYGLEGAFEDTSMADVRKQFETNVFGLVGMCQLVLPKMREQRSGRIVNISSVGGKVTFPGGAFYHGTKHAVEAMSDVLRFEVAGFGIRVAIVEPGLIKTAFGDTATASIGDASGSPYGEFNAAVAKRVAGAYEGMMGRLAAGPDAVAKAIEHAVSSRHPRTRYRVTVGARFVLTSRKVLPDRAYDLMMRSQFPQPKA